MPEAPQRRSSPGGNIVTGSLVAVGYRQPSSVALVETATPRRTAYDVVLCQNAWNFVPAREFVRLSRGYHPGRRALYAARRAVAAVNTRRTATPVVLSGYMAGLLAARGHEPVVSPVTLLLDLCGSTAPPTRAPTGVEAPFVLVPGTLTPYKNADYALELLRLLPPTQRPLLVLAGTDDGSGQRQHLTDILLASGLRHWVGPVDREEMAWLLENAVATVVPSLLESLSFSVAEALVLSARVMASPLPVHREVATRLGRDPLWLPPEPTIATARAMVESRPAIASSVDRARYLQEWHDLSALLESRTAQG